MGLREVERWHPTDILYEPNDSGFCRREADKANKRAKQVENLLACLENKGWGVSELNELSNVLMKGI